MYKKIYQYSTRELINRILKYLLKLFKKYISDKNYIKLYYFLLNGKKINLENPQTFYEKLLWLKLNYKDPIMHTCVDKLAVRDYIEKKIGAKYLIPLLGVYEKTKDIDIDNLPKQFVLKTTHTSGDVIICKDKNNFNLKKHILKMNRWLKIDYYNISKEWCYKGIKPKIICEKYISDGVNEVPKDYKIFCFNGKPIYIVVYYDRYNGEPSQTVYDTMWNALDFCISENFYREDKFIEEKPRCLEEMLKVAEILSKDFIHVRVDLYNIKEVVLFGELTFFSAGGMSKTVPQEQDKVIGKLIDISRIDDKGYYNS